MLVSLLKLQKYIPEICMGVGAACVILGSVESCKATLNVEDILDDARKTLDEVHKIAEEEHKDEKEVRKAVAKTYLHTGWRLAKNYSKGISLTMLGLASCFYGFGTLNGRYVGSVAAYNGLKETYDRLNRGVIDKYGKDARDEILYGVTREEVEYEEVDDEGNTKVRKAKKARVMPEGYSGNAVIFDSSNPNWTKNANYNLMFLRGVENYINDLLNSRGHVFLNDVFDALGMRRTPDGAIKGWVKGYGDGYISFGIDWEDGEKHPSVRRFLNGLEPSVWLDFNIDGLIWNLI